ncbi:hypothetical protein BGZ58_008769 [Dissophora ornata]|nr:hypothetical protein BGZ58_008769 [Dissophora ornata]
MSLRPRNRALNDLGGGVTSGTTEKDTSTQLTDMRSREETQVTKGHSKPENETVDKNTADASSSSEAEDLAELEELAQKKASLEAKLHARKLRKAEKARKGDSVQERPGETAVTDEAAAPNIDSEGEVCIAVTPKRNRAEIQSDRKLELNPLVIDFTDGPTERSPSDMDLPDDDLHDSLWDVEFERHSPEPTTNEKFNEPSVMSGNDKSNIKESASHSLASMAVSGGSTGNRSVTEVLEAQRLKREAELEKQKAPKTTFHTIAASGRPLTTTESTQLTPDFDPTTGFRIRDRVTSCEDVAKMTRDLRIIPIKDGDGIRENEIRHPSSGILPSSTSGRSASVGSNGNGNSDTAIESKASSWVVAGVVGAKSKERTTANKSKFCQFHLCDLKSGVITVFMFGTVKERYHKRLQIGDVVAILDPKVLKQAERTPGTIGVQIEHPDCLMIIGTSSDVGQCKAVKMNGENCGRLLDTRVSAYCAQHIMMVADSRRNQRGSLIAGTGSIYDLDKLPMQAGPANLPRKIGGAAQPNVQSNKLRMMAHGSRETTYIFDDGGIGSSSLIDHKSSKKGNERPDDVLSSFLMSQNNPGGQYLRQAKANKEVAWAKDVSSPKTPTKTELFPAEMIRRMGYDPVAGAFVPGSPKRSNDDLEARERSIRLLAERVKSPPAPMRSLKDLSPIRQRTIDVNGTARPIAQPRPRTGKTPSGSVAANLSGREVKGDVYFADQASRPKWVSLDDGDSSGDDSDGQGNLLLSLSKQRAMNLLEVKTAEKGPTLAAVAGGAAPRTLGMGIQTRVIPQTQVPAAAQQSGTGVLMATKRRNSLLQQATPSSSSSSSVRDATASGSKQPTLSKITASLESSAKPSAVSGVDTQLNAPGSSATATLDNEGSSNKKPRFVDLSDSE